MFKVRVIKCQGHSSESFPPTFLFLINLISLPSFPPFIPFSLPPSRLFPLNSLLSPSLHPSLPSFLSPFLPVFDNYSSLYSSLRTGFHPFLSLSLPSSSSPFLPSSLLSVYPSLPYVFLFPIILPPIFIIFFLYLSTIPSHSRQVKRTIHISHTHFFLHP